MTNPPDSPLADVLRLYAEHPLEDGDAVLLVDDEVCLETGDLSELRSDGLRVLLSTATRVQVAIARSREVLLPEDFQLWRDLHADLRGTQVQLLPVRALPAA